MPDAYQVEQDIRRVLRRLDIEPIHITTSSRDDINGYARNPVKYMTTGRMPQKVHATVWLPRKLNLLERQTLRQVEQYGVHLDIMDNA